jgi:hypothetical protein
MGRKGAALVTAAVCCIILAPVAAGCKDIVAVGDATAGPYNLLLKVRDPSRPGPQVLTRVPAGYTYTFYDPWTGKPFSCTVTRTYIGTASAGDTAPNLVKAGRS